MPKIKTKKEMTLPELIDWVWDNKVKNKKFYGNRGGLVLFDEDSWVSIEEDNVIEPIETFDVEIEEEQL